VDRCAVNRLQTLTGMICLLEDDQTIRISEKRFEYLTVDEISDFTRAATMKNTVLWHVTACSVVECRRRFGRK